MSMFVEKCNNLGNKVKFEEIFYYFLLFLSFFKDIYNNAFLDPIRHSPLFFAVPLVFSLSFSRGCRLRLFLVYRQFIDDTADHSQ